MSFIVINLKSLMIIDNYTATIYELFRARYIMYKSSKLH